MGGGTRFASTIGAGLGSLGFARRVVVFLAAEVLARVAAARRVVTVLRATVLPAAVRVVRPRLAAVVRLVVDFGLVTRVVARGRDLVAADVCRVVDRPLDRVDRPVDRVDRVDRVAGRVDRVVDRVPVREPDRAPDRDAVRVLARA